MKPPSLFIELRIPSTAILKVGEATLLYSFIPSALEEVSLLLNPEATVSSMLSFIELIFCEDVSSFSGILSVHNSLCELAGVSSDLISEDTDSSGCSLVSVDVALSTSSCGFSGTDSAGTVSYTHLITVF